MLNGMRLKHDAAGESRGPEDHFHIVVCELFPVAGELYIQADADTGSAKIKIEVSWTTSRHNALFKHRVSCWRCARPCLIVNPRDISRAVQQNSGVPKNVVTPRVN